MTSPRYILRLGREVFGAHAACLGSQFIELLEALNEVMPELRWYVADVQAIGRIPFGKRQPLPTSIGSAAALIQSVREVEQFESGVFAGVPLGVTHPAFRSGGLWTEDDDDDELGDAVVEVRAFDTSYWLVATNAQIIADRVRALTSRGR